MKLRETQMSIADKINKENMLYTCKIGLILIVELITVFKRWKQLTIVSVEEEINKLT